MYTPMQRERRERGKHLHVRTHIKFAMATDEEGAGGVVVRQVWADNVDYEFSLIRSVVNDGRFRFAAFDTEYPGTIYIPAAGVDPRRLSPTQTYELLKLNVDALHIVQLGLALSDAAGCLPDLGTRGAVRFVWQFNFRDFHLLGGHPHNPDSVCLLFKQGIDFHALRCRGLDSRRFAELLASSGLLGAAAGVIWVTFHGAYDFGYVVKALLGGRRLPPRMADFLGVVRDYFGPLVFDVKHVMRHCQGMHGGLEKAAELLCVPRDVGQAHQAGSDALLAARVFAELTRVYFFRRSDILRAFAGVLYGLEPLCYFLIC